MNQETVAWLAVALLSISALGVSATTLESTVSTDANDVINLDYDQVPIGQDTASSTLDEIEGSERDGESTTQVNRDGPGAAESASTQPADSSRAESSSSEQASQSQSQQQQRSEGDTASGGLEPMSLFERILALLTSLLRPLLALAALIAAVGLAVRYRERLLALLPDAAPDDPDGPTAAESSNRFEGSPAHAIEGAWLGMVRRLDVEEPETMTTSECAAAAVEAGLDREAVRRLTETYEEVRYGGQPVTEHREQVARQSQRRLELGGGT